MITLQKYISDKGAVILALLFLVLLNPFMVAHLFIYALLFIFFVLKKNTLFSLMDKNFVWIFAFSLIYTLFFVLNVNTGPQGIIMRLLFPPLYYLLGKYLVTEDLQYTGVVNLLLLLGIVYATSTLLSVGTNLLESGFNVTERDVPDFWNGKTYVSTGLAGYLIYVLVLPGIVMANKHLQRNRLLLVVLTGIYIVALLSSFRIGSRTAIAVIGIGILVGIIFRLLGSSLIQGIRFITGLVVVSLLFYNFVPINLDAEYLSILGDRLQSKESSSISTAGNRTGLWQESFENLFKHPLGWESDHFAHNSWLDIAKTTGVIPLILFMVLNYLMLLSLLKTMKFDQERVGYSLTFSLYFLVSYILWFSEPVVLGNLYAFSIVFLFFGVLKQHQHFISKRIEVPK